MTEKELMQCWTIYESSFPEEEKRDFVSQKRVLGNEKYTIEPYHVEGTVVGFIALWVLENFCFIEHLAIDGAYRGCGYGRRIIEDVKNKYPGPFVLEVEPPDDEITKKRIRFYEKAGFKLNSYDYLQPPYKEGSSPIQLKLMSYPSLLQSQSIDWIKETIYRNVYGIK